MAGLDPTRPAGRDADATVTISVDILDALEQEVRVSTGHFESPALRERFATHDRRMPDGSCLICTMLDLIAIETAPQPAERVQATWECAIGPHEMHPYETRNFMPPQFAIDGPVCDCHAAELRRGHAGATAPERAGGHCTQGCPS